MRYLHSSVLARLGRRASLVAVAVALALAVVPASALAGGFTAHLKAPNHHPTAGKKWWITVTARHGRSKPGGKVSYRFLFQGQVVAHRPGHKFAHGHYRDWLLFPRAAIGHPITLQVVVQTRWGTDYLNWAVTTRG
jgi:hypothetical protein